MSTAFWDTSAIVPLCCSQPATRRGRAIYREATRGVMWWGTSVETRSALARLVREGQLTDAQRLSSAARFAQLRDAWDEILPSAHLRSLAEELPDRFTLRAADAMQLAAALVWCRERARGRVFVCFDDRLAIAADAAGVAVRS